MRLLDLGCGFAKYHTEYSKTYDEIVGIDIDREAIKYAEKAFPFNKYSVFDICKNLDSILKNEKFDFVLAQDVLEHVLQPRTMIENMLKYVTNEGTCYIVSPSALAYEINFRFHRGQEKINKPTMQYLTPCVVKGIINRIGGKVVWQSMGCRWWVRPIKIIFKRRRCDMETKLTKTKCDNCGYESIIEKTRSSICPNCNKHKLGKNPKCPKCGSKNTLQTITEFRAKFGDEYICGNCDHCW